MSKRTFKEDKLAKLYDAEVVPIWSRRFGRMLLRELTVPTKAMVLDVNCGSGYPSLEILRRMDEQGRIIAIDTSSPLLDEARNKAGKLSGKRIFFRSESALPKLSFAEEVYDLVYSNAGIHQLDDPEPAVRECARVAKVGGRVVVTYALAGTFGEFHDLFREVLIKGDYKDAIDRLDAYLTRYPPLEQAVGWFEDAGLTDIETEYESFTLLFKSSREFFFAPIIEYGPLSNWKAVAGKGQQMQDVFWQTKAAIDAYFHGTSFSVTVNAGCIRGRKAAREPSVQVAVPPPPPPGPYKGERASSKPRRGSRPSGVVGAPVEKELPDAPSDEVDALSGSWPLPMPESAREPSGSGVDSEPKWEIADLQIGDEIPTFTGHGRPRIAEPTPPDFPVAPASEDEVELGTGDVVLPGERDLDEEPVEEVSETGEVQLGTGEIELVEGSVSTTDAKPGRRGKLVRRDTPDDPDDPDIL
jgi:ubiquinone/menaquinone biosynthesis C-methylase UbiE